MSALPRVAIVDADRESAEPLARELISAGFAVRHWTEGRVAVQELLEDPPQLAIVELELPDIEGFELCRLIKRSPESSDTRLMIVTTRDAPMDRIVGLEIGADDYVCKPFSLRELSLRVRSVMRDQLEPSGGLPLMQVGDVRLDENVVHVRGEEVPLTAMEYRLLHLLMSQPNRVLSRETLLKKVWGYPPTLATRTLDTHIRRLRIKLGVEGKRIETVIRAGYRFRAGVASTNPSVSNQLA